MNVNEPNSPPLRGLGLRVAPTKHTKEYVTAGVLLLLAAWAATSIANNENFQWHVVGHYFFASPVMRGLLATCQLAVITMLLGIVGGVVVAAMRMSRNRVIVSVSWFYIWIVRGTPILVQLIFFYNLGALYPHIVVGLPFAEPFASWETTSLIGGWMAGVLGLSLNGSAQMAEIIRGGILAVDRGQSEAGRALGMTERQISRRIVLPQALRAIIPPTGSQVIHVTLLTSLVSVISISDLLFATEVIAAQTFQIIPLLIVASLWYLLLASVLMIGQHFLERWYSRSESARARPVETDPLTPGARLAEVGPVGRGDAW